MKKSVLAIFLATLMVFSSVGVMAAKKERDDVTIVFDGGFERGMFFWGSADWSDGKTAKFEEINEDPHSGEKCLKITSETLAFASQGVALAENEKYEVSIWAKSAGVGIPANASVKFEFNSIIGGFIDAAEGSVTVKGDGWQESTFSFVTPAGTVGANLYIQNIEGELYYDDLVVTGKITDRAIEAYDANVDKGNSVFVQQAIDGGELLKSGGYELLGENGYPVDVNASGGWDGPFVTLQSDETYEGNYAAHIKCDTGDYAWTMHVVYDLEPGATYQATCMYKGTTDPAGGTVGWQVETYARNICSVDTARGSFGAPEKFYSDEDEWRQAIVTWTMPENATMVNLVIGCYPGLCDVYIDDVHMYMVKPPKLCNLVTDRVFYYPEAQTGRATLTFHRLYDAVNNYTVQYDLFDGEKLLATEKNAKIIDNQAIFVYPMSLMKKKKHEYTLRATVYDKEGAIEDELEQPLYVYDRPKALNENGEYIKDGKVFTSVMAYQVPIETYQQLADAGINTMLWVIPGDMESAKRELDEMEKMGIMAMVVCFWDMYPAGNPLNLERVADAVRKIKDHPAIHSYITADEPFSHDPKAENDMINGYKMLRDIDDVHPVTYVEDNWQRYKEGGNYADIFQIDPYPGNGRDYGRTVGDMSIMATEDLNHERPVTNILQAFTFVTRPETHELRNMMYASFLGGCQSIGYYAVESWADVDPRLTESTDFWPMMQKFYDEEYDLVFRHYSSGKEPIFNKSLEDELWYETWEDNGTLYSVVLNRTTDEKTVTIPLTSQNGKITINDYDFSIIADGDASAITKKSGALEIKLTSRQPLLIKITPKEKYDYSCLTDIGDIDNFDWAKDDILSLYEKGIVDKSYMDPTFRPGEFIKRDEFASMLIRAIDYTKAGGERFEDVPADSPYLKEILMGRKVGILQGVGDNKFMPDSDITRQDLLTIAARGMKVVKGFIPGTEADIASFADRDKISDYAFSDIAAMVRYQIIKGDEYGNINPLGKTTRAEAAAIINRIINWKNN